MPASGFLSEHVARYIRAYPHPALEEDSGFTEIGVDTATQTLKFAAGGVTKEVMDLSSNQTVTGVKTFAAGLRRPVIAESAPTRTLTVTESGSVFLASLNSGTQVFTLPPTRKASGVYYTFVCAGPEGELHVAPDPGDLISGKTHGGAEAVAISTGAALVNPAATNVSGDACTVISDGMSLWIMIAVQGVWSGT
jgi:hypothetical protein